METALSLARGQFAATTLFHMIFALVSIGLSFFIVLLEAMWLRTRNEMYFRHVRFWASVFVVIFGVGVASGIPLEFQFGTNWSRFAGQSGEIMGNLLAFEAAISFALEAAFLAIMIFGWDRVSRRLHMFSAIMVALGATLSAFWIMAANSWMQTPAGIAVAPGKISVVDYFAATFNPDFPIAFIHIWVASIESVAFVLGGICAWYLLKKRNVEFFLPLFKVAIVIAIVLAPLQVFLGDQSGLTVLKHQPAKAAAMEANWKTYAEGEGAPWIVVGWPDDKAEKNDWQIDVPYMLSILDTRSLTGQVEGLKDFPADERPPVVLPFYAFRLMVVLGVGMVLVALLSVWLWLRKRLQTDNVHRNRLFLKIWIFALPAGILATEFGWVVREVGRQPWIVYGVLRTSDGVSGIGTVATAWSLALFILFYVVLLAVSTFFIIRILRKGPDMSSPLPERSREN